MGGEISVFGYFQCPADFLSDALPIVAQFLTFKNRKREIGLISKRFRQLPIRLESEALADAVEQPGKSSKAEAAGDTRAAL